MDRTDLLKVAKITIGCVLALYIAQSFSLSYATAIVTITLLSIQNTKRDTLLIAVRRFFSFFLALTLSIILFPLLNYSLLSLGLYLMLFTFGCQFLDLLDGLSMSTVLMVQLWNSGNITPKACLNQFAIMSIGISIGALTNLYMPDKEKEIKHYQESIEEAFTHIIILIARKLREPKEYLPMKPRLRKLETQLRQGKSLAYRIEKNHLFHKINQYSLYMELYEQQFGCLARIGNIAANLDSSYPQSKTISIFLHRLSEELHSCCNAGKLLEDLNQMRLDFKSSPLPSNRKEFEDRALLTEIVRELITIIELKRQNHPTLPIEK